MRPSYKKKNNLLKQRVLFNVLEINKIFVFWVCHLCDNKLLSKTTSL